MTSRRITISAFRLIAATAMAGFIGTGQAAVISGSVTGYGSATPNDGSGVLDRSEVFFPNTNKVRITGSVDLTNLQAGDAIMIGLVNKPTADEQIDNLGWSFWENKDAWAHFTLTGAGTYRVGLGDFVGSGGEIVQNWIDLPGPVVDDFVLEIGLNMMDLMVGAASVPTKSYGTPHAFWDSYFSSPSPIDPEFSSGAYLLAGSFAGGSASFDVTASAVPEPASIALLGLGLAGIGYQRRRSTA